MPVFHVDARLTADQIRTTDPANADRMASQGVTEALWFDWLGQMVQGEQSLAIGGRGW
ncbi:hypothetical protein [Kitasatospora aureofaciens]|uniref:hypothetical protein n=1 Tax=Kitasatospora aureofaciens TaxID=1894 RepID=UPI00131D85D2|nr:hypothetical protein [Kitasatospora aureofaciens]